MSKEREYAETNYINTIEDLLLEKEKSNINVADTLEYLAACYIIEGIIVGCKLNTEEAEKWLWKFTTHILRSIGDTE